ncbi:hypothetical protein BD310DRAFT_360499 [Dichomitus squalens]|uniref:Uncharacterized protein n=1 Tax=Dichomitus squalens TaxID=114155 RepID=A0A4Q9PG36_9APHY|nr:hypothetical protein BD310DRAFT_360499 [Dichomitus squalens]
MAAMLHAILTTASTEESTVRVPREHRGKAHKTRAMIRATLLGSLYTVAFRELRHASFVGHDIGSAHSSRLSATSCAEATGVGDLSNRRLHARFVEIHVPDRDLVVLEHESRRQFRVDLPIRVGIRCSKSGEGGADVLNVPPVLGQCTSSGDRRELQQ